MFLTSRAAFFCRRWHGGPKASEHVAIVQFYTIFQAEQEIAATHVVGKLLSPLLKMTPGKVPRDTSCRS